MNKSYTVVTAQYLANLEKFVNRRMEEGFVPLGGLIAVPVRHGYNWCQPMIKNEKSDD